MKPMMNVCMLFALAFFGCSGKGDACEGVHCGTGGYCQETEDGWTCICYEEFYPKIDGICYARQFACGHECKDHNWCESFYCYLPPGYESGFCSVRGCVSHDDCSDCYGADLPLCCAELRSGNTACMGVLDGYECGIQDKGCGSSCVGQLDTACLPELACLRENDDDPDAFCSMRCESDEDCADCGTASVCREWSSGFSYCQPEEG